MHMYSYMYHNLWVYLLLLYVLWGGKTALHYCSEHGHASIAEVLIRTGANVNAVARVSKANELKLNVKLCICSWLMD